MSRLLLKRASASRPSGEWSDDDYDVLADRGPREGCQWCVVAGAPVTVSAPEEGGLEADPLVRMSHFSFCALKNSR
jgi:hypothetical protein